MKMYSKRGALRKELKHSVSVLKTNNITRQTLRNGCGDYEVFKTSHINRATKCDFYRGIPDLTTA